MRTGWVVLYFLAGSAVLALCVFPHWREALLARRWGRWWSSGAPWRRVGGAHPAPAWPAHAGSLRFRRWGGLLALALLVMPVMTVIGWDRMSPRSLDGFDDLVRPGNVQVSHLLEGEQLSPPPPLPPEVFTTAEVTVLRPMLDSADRRWDRMDKAFVQRLLLVFKIMKEEHGYDMALLEGWRSPERQTALAAQGSNVTMAGAWQSYHQHGLAADCAFYRDGRLVISEKDAWAMRGYTLYGQVAERVGLTWGGRWRMMDFGHVEWRKPGVMQAVRPR